MKTFLKSLTILSFSIILVACGGGGTSSDIETPSAPAPINNPPTVSVENIAADENTSVTIIAVANDVDGDSLTYSWSQTSGEKIEFVENTSSISIDTPEIIADSDYSFEVSVFDGSLTTKASLIITVNNVNKTPTVSIESIAADENTPVTITASASDPDGDSLTYIWSQLSGESITFTYNGSSISFDAPEVATNTKYTFEVTVSDGKDSVHAETTLTVHNIPLEPTTWIFKSHKSDFLTVVGHEHGMFIYDALTFDVNGDGLLDVVTGGPSMDDKGWSGEQVPLVVLINKGDYTFENSPTTLFGDNPISSQIHTRAIEAADFNLDGSLDIFLAGSGFDVAPWSGEVSSLIMSEGDKWRDTSSDLNWVNPAMSHGAKARDINGDNYPDIVFTDINASTDGEQIIVLMNNGNGIFSENSKLVPFDIRSSKAWHSVEISDLDGDGCEDLILGANRESNESLISWNYCGLTGFSNQSDSLTIPQPLDSRFTMANELTPVDINGDAKMDLFVVYNDASYQGKYIQVLINKGKRNFDDESNKYFPFQAVNDPTWATNLYHIDLDNDNDLDLVVFKDSGRKNSDLNLVWENRNGVFQPVDDPNLELSGTLIPIDVDNDGDIDFISRTVTGIPQETHYTIIENLTVNR